MSQSAPHGRLRAGWAVSDITPDQPVLIAGQFHSRVSEGVDDPITVTALALDSGEDHAVFVSCDLVSIPDALRDAVRAQLAQSTPELDPKKVILHGTHTHTGPEVRLPEVGAGHTSTGTGVELSAMPIEDYVRTATDRIAEAVLHAWRSRAPSGMAFGQGVAVVGRNRRSTDRTGKSTMYGNTDTAAFSHIEGYEDHSVNVMAAYDEGAALTGLVVNVPCPAQVDEGAFTLSADYWYETRQELRRRFGEHLPILAQCSAAGDQSPHLLFEKRAAERMLALMGRTEREEIARRLANSVEEALRGASAEIDNHPILNHHAQELLLPMTPLNESDARTAEQEAETLRLRYEEEKRKLDTDPQRRNAKRWYQDVTAAYRQMRWYERVAERYRRGEAHPTLAAELHVIRLGDMAFATNPFEYYLDYGVYIKARSRAVQTLVVQLAGQGTYVPSRRSMAGGGYGSIPASNPVGPEGGWQIAEQTVAVIERLWENSEG